MIGTYECTASVAERLTAVREAFDARRRLSLWARKELRHVSRAPGRTYSYRPRFAKIIRGLERCVLLAEQFQVVERDSRITRKMEVRDGSSYGRPHKIDVPLVFGCKLPAPRVHTETIVFAGSNYSAKAVVPHPTPEALAAVKEHRHLFDWIELWWVPNDVLVEKIPDPDPIVVGAVEIPQDEKYYFELHRWIDETVEVGWWSKEGY